MLSVQGHRGARGALPENTLPAFHYAIEVGADMLELDIGVTRDGALMVAHDFFLNAQLQRWRDGRAIGKEEPLHAFTAEQLRGLDCGSQTDPAFPKQKAVQGASMPTLEDVFDYVRDMKHPHAKNVGFNVEIKSIPAGDGLLHPKPREFAKLVVSALKKRALGNRIVVQSFDHRVLAEIRKLDKTLRLSALTGDVALDYVSMAKKLKVQAVSAQMYWITRADVLALHKAKVRVFTWTANEMRDWERLIALKVDGIITDYPAELLEFLRSRKLHR